MTTTQAEAARRAPRAPSRSRRCRTTPPSSRPSDGPGARRNGSRSSPYTVASFTRSQCVRVLPGDTAIDRKPAARFVLALIEKRLASEDQRPIFPGGARAILLTGKPIYHALGIPDVRHRRSKAAIIVVLTRRLLSLDYIIERPTFGWLPTEADKVRRFEALGLDRRTFPYRLYGPEGTAADPALFCVQAAGRRRRSGGNLRVRGRPPNDRQRTTRLGHGPHASLVRASCPDFRRARRRCRLGRGRGRPRRALAQTLDP